MIGSIAEFHSKNGVLRRFKDGAISDVLRAETSQDGTFCAANTSEGLVTFKTLTSQPVKLHLDGEINGFCWANHVRSVNHDLSLPRAKDYLVVLDKEFNICLYSVVASEISSQPCKVELTSFMSKSSYIGGFNASESTGSASSLKLINAVFDDYSSKFETLLLIDGERLLKLCTKQNCEPSVDYDIKLNQSCGMFNHGGRDLLCSKVKDSFLSLIDEQGTLYIFCMDSKEVLLNVPLIEYIHIRSLSRKESSHKEWSSDCCKCSISNDLRYIIFSDEDDKVLHLIHINIDEVKLLDQLERTPHVKGSKEGIPVEFDDIAAMYGMEIKNEVWRDELNAFHTEINNAELNTSQDLAVQHLSTESDPDVSIIQEYIEVALPEWTAGFNAEEIALGTNTMLIKMSTANESFAFPEADEDRRLHSLVLQYDFHSKLFVAQSLPENAVIATSESGFFPTCILSRDVMYVPTFNKTQEELISSIIQYTGIAEAETICRSNQWSQFSVPLHSLEVGLQHRQIDTISFFLRTRDKAFSRYWKHMSMNGTTSDVSASTSSQEVNADFVGSPSCKSILVRSSMDSTCIDPSELHQAVDMLVKAIHHDSKGKHKKNFFETLLRLTMDFVNSLIMDGAAVLESQGPAANRKISSSSFTFLVDIPESLSYLVNCIVDVRKFIGDIPEFYTIQKDADVIDGHGESATKNSDKLLRDYMEAEIYAGRFSRLQRCLLEKDDLDCSFATLTDFGLEFAFRKLKQRNINDAVRIIKNLGADERAILRQLFILTLDRGLRNYLLSEFHKDPYRSLLTEDDLSDVQYLKDVEESYPCNVYKKDNIKDYWETLKGHLHDIDDLVVDDNEVGALKSLQDYEEELTQSVGLYCELMFKWIKQWDDRSRKFVLLDAAYQSNQLEHISELADTETLWDYLTSHNNTESILEWIRTWNTHLPTSSEKPITYPPFDPSLVHKCGHATTQVKKAIYRDFIRLGIYTDEMKQDFQDILKIVSEDCSLFRKSDENYTVPPIFVHQFIKYCLKSNLREILFLYLDHHELYPNNDDIILEDVHEASIPWFKMLNAVRNFQRDKQGVLEMSLSTAENILRLSGEGLRAHICCEKPLTILATVLSSSLQLSKVFTSDARESQWLDKSLLKESLKRYPALHSAIFADSRSKEEVTTIQLLQDNTELDAIEFFQWRKSGNFHSSVPNFSSKELLDKFGLRVNLTYTYYLKQKRPVFAYLTFMKEYMKGPNERKNWLKKAFLEAYELAIENFDKIPICAACTYFVDLLGMDSYALRVEIESANFILQNMNRCEYDQFDSDETLTEFIVTCLRKKENGRLLLLQILERCVESGLQRENICWSSFEAILYYRTVVQFAQVSGLPPPVRLIEEAIKDECWFHAVVFMQIYQLKPSEILPSLDRSMSNAVLRDHVYAIIKNAKKMEKVLAQQVDSEQSQRKDKKLSQAVPAAAQERDFRAQFYYSLKKGPDNNPVEVSELVSPTKSVSTMPTEGQLQKKELSKLGMGSNEVIDEEGRKRREERFDTIGRLGNILDIILECEDTVSPSAMMLKYATNYSQPFLAVLAACYQDSNSLDCLCSWVVSSIDKSKRHFVFRSFSDLRMASCNIKELFSLFSDALQNEEKSIKIIADGFRVFMNKNALYPFFQFCDLFATKEDRKVCALHLSNFVTTLEKAYESSSDHEYVEAFFEAGIPARVLNTFKSNFYKRKLLELYIDSGLNRFLPQKSISFERLKTICELTTDTAVIPDYLALTSCVQDNVDCEEDRIYVQLIEQKHLGKAIHMSKLLGLPAWKVTLSQVENEILEMKKSRLWYNPEARLEFWMTTDSRLRKCLCSNSVAGSFFETQGLKTDGLLLDERALLLAMAFDWYVANSGSENDAHKEEMKKLEELEKKAWLFKINAEVAQLEAFGNQSTEQASKSNPFSGCSIKISQLFSQRSRTSSGVQYKGEERNLLISEDVFEGDDASDTKIQWDEKENEAFDVVIGDLLENGEIAHANRVSKLFGKTNCDLNLVLTSVSLAQGTQQVDSLDERLKTLLAKTPTRSLSISGSYDRSSSAARSVGTPGSLSSTGVLIADWVLIEEVQNAIEKLASKSKRGKKCCERVLICFSVSKTLSMTYEDIVSLQPFEVLRLLVFSDVDLKLNLCRQFLRIFCIKDNEMAAFIAKIVLRLIQSKANIALSKLTVQEFTDTTKLNSNEIPRLMQLVQKPSILGTLLMEEAKSMEINQQNDYDVNLLEVLVELLIRAHDCFTLSCNMEGISEVLHAARLCNLQLIQTKSYSLMVRLLTGIGRFKEMSYVFEALNEEHHFELLFRKNIEKETQLKNALLDYIKKNHPNDPEKIDMLSMRFGMHREVGEQFEETGERQIHAICGRFSAISKDMETDLKSISKTFSYAAANYKKVACLRKSTRCLKMARLAELQIRLLPQGKQIIGLEKQAVKKLLSAHQDFYEALLIADAYSFMSPSSWVEPLFERVILKGELSYLRQYLSVYQLTGTVVMEIVSRYRLERLTSSTKEHLKELLSHLKDARLRYKIAAEFSFNDIINDLLETPSGAYLKDSMFAF